MRPRWEILILSLPSRKEMLSQLISLLEPQVATLGLRRFDLVDIHICSDQYWNRPMDLGEKREYMRQRSHAEYVSFFDDDDLPEPDYIGSILPLLDGVDQVTHNFSVQKNYELLGIAYHSLGYDDWYEKDGNFYRDISHMTPMRRELALACKMSGDRGEDFRWARAMREMQIVKTEHKIPRVLYHYLMREPRDDAKDANDSRRLALIDHLRPAR